MLGKLTDRQIELVLYSQMIGRIGYYASEKIYIIPVTYVFYQGCIYAHSQDGHKVQTMRKNPNVCFQVDAIENTRNWRSVILWGEYEELTRDRDQLSGMEVMADRLAPFVISESVSAATNFNKSSSEDKGKKAVMYRIRIKEKTGRFEKA
jgi:uncharacterized protein